MEIYVYTKQNDLTNDIIRQLSRLFEDMVEDPRKLNKSYFYQKIKQEHFFICAIENNQMLGVCEAYIVSEQERNKHTCLVVSIPRDIIFLANIVVDRSHRSLGIGSKLLQFAEEYGRTKKCKRALLDVLYTNERARHLYERLGYKITHVSHQLNMMRSTICDIRGEDTDVDLLPYEVYKTILPETHVSLLKRDIQVLKQDECFSCISFPEYKFSIVGLLKHLPGYMYILAFLSDKHSVQSSYASWMELIAKYYFTQHPEEKELCLEYFSKNLAMVTRIIPGMKNERFYGFLMQKTL